VGAAGGSHASSDRRQDRREGCSSSSPQAAHDAQRDGENGVASSMQNLHVRAVVICGADTVVQFPCWSCIKAPTKEDMA
jgi:hypothetical protein